MRHQIRLTEQKIQRRLALIESLVYRHRQPLPPFRFRSLGQSTDLPELPVDDSQWETIPPSSYWGGKDINFLLSTTFTVPPAWTNPALHLPIGVGEDFLHPEALVYIDDAPFATIDRFHDEILLPERWCDGNQHRLMLHGWTGWVGSVSSEPGKRIFMRPCHVVHIDAALRGFIATARVALQVAQNLDENHPARDRLFNALDAAFIALDTREPFGDHTYTSVRHAQSVLLDGIADAGAPLDVEIIAAGHAHIDTAWLWTLGQTRRKVGRTFHTILRFMEQFPNFHFAQSQSQLYEYARQDYPGLFEAIKQRVAEGRWELLGGMWVEADCNLSSGESLVRQLTLGRGYFRQHFGTDAESPVLWLPDVFGYAWNLPQLIKQADLDYFFTIKIGWNRYNKLPYDSFWWQGLDGTKVLTHFSTTPEAIHPKAPATYNAELSGMTVIATWNNLKHKPDERVMLMSYGWGDGGGGPDRLMLENAAALDHFPAAPRVTQGRVIDFFRRLETESGARLPTWNGELYLEAHRGTYTSQARTKRGNRKSEFLLHDAEFLATAASLLDPGYSYPHATFNKAWEIVCLNQFHDIIPGSSISQVYVEALAHYAEVEAMVSAARAEALAAIARRLGGDVLLVNPTHIWRADSAFVQLPAGCSLQPTDDAAATIQPDANGSCWIASGELPPYSIAPMSAARADNAALAPIEVTPTLLDNGVVRVELNSDGDIVRVYDYVRERDLLPAGALANQFQAFEDRPLDWDAWDIDIFFDDKLWHAEPASSVRVLRAGALRGTLEIRRRVLNSEIVQQISLSRDSARIDFDTWVDWRERHILLKVAFPVDLLSPVAQHEVQFGYVERPTHRSTSWDWARFETCAHKWIRLGESDYGAALLNDCKYGHDVQDNVMRLSLLRSPTNPDPEADQGEHRFTYSLLPNASLADAISEGYKLNDPLIAAPGSGQPAQTAAWSLCSIEGEGGAVIETIKRAEDGSGVIVRLYQSERRREWVTLRTGFALRGAYVTNLLEDNQAEVAIEPSADMLRLYLKPFQIVTLRLLPAL